MESLAGSTTVTVPAANDSTRRGLFRYQMPVASGAHFLGLDASMPFFAVGAMDADASGSGNNVHDWGYSLIPESFLTSAVKAGWAPGTGAIPPTANGSPLWITPIAATRIYVDFDGNPLTGPNIDSNGNRYDVAYDLRAFESKLIYDPDNDQTGARVYTTDGVKITGAWGQDPSTAQAGNPFLDVGYTLLPVPVTTLSKEGSIVDDDGDGLVDDGERVRWSIIVKNDGVVPLSGLTVIDDLNSTLTYIAGTTYIENIDGTGSVLVPDGTTGTPFPLDESGYVITSLAVGEAKRIRFDATAVIALGVAQVVNEVLLTGAEVPLKASDSIPTDHPGDLSITKTDGSDNDVAGTSIVYTIVVRNTGTSTATGVRMTDIVPPSITDVSWTAIYSLSSSGPASGTGNSIDAVFNLRPNATATFTVSGTISPSATGVLSNTATITPPPTFTDTNPNNNSATDETTLTVTADLVVSKTDGKDTAIPGTANSYTIVVTNNGPSNVIGALVSDDLPAALSDVTWTASYSNGSSGVASGTGDIVNAPINLLAGGTATFIVNGTFVPSALGTITNTATVDPPAGVIDPNLDNNHADDVTTMTPQGDISVTKTDGLTNATPGTQITYTIVVTNSGPSVLTDAILTDNLPANLTDVTWTADYSIGSAGRSNGTGSLVDISFGLEPLGTATFYVTGTILSNATGVLSNTATVTPLLGFVDTNPDNNSATDTTNLVPAGDLSITKTDNITSIAAGGAITYTIVVSNAGPSDVVGALVNDTLPASILGATWTVAYSAGSSGSVSSGAGNINGVSVNLRSGGTATFTVSGTVSGTATGTLSNTATVTAPGSFLEANTANNSATDTTQISANYDLSITKTDNQATAYSGSPISYTIVVTNSGPSNITGALVNDGLPAAIQNAAWSVSYVNGSGATSGTGSISNAAINLLAGGTATFVINGTVASGFTGTLSNTATVTPPDALDADPDDNSATDTTEILPAADLTISKSNGASSVVPGTQTTYTITVTNLGPSAISGASVADVLPSGTTFVTATNGAVYNPSTRTVQFTSGLLASGGTSSFDVTLAVASNLQGSLTNTATVTAPAGVFDPNPNNNTASDSDPLTPQGNLSIVKTNSNATEAPGGEVMYTIVVTNSGPSELRARVQDLLPASLSNISWTAVFTGLTSTGTGTGTGNIDEVILLYNGGTATYVVTATLDAGATGSLVNTATVAPQPGYTDTNPNDNSSTVTNPLAPRGDLSITKVDNVAVSAIPGERMGYTIVVSNAGPSHVVGAVVEDLLPSVIIAADWTVVYSNGSRGSVNSGSGNISNVLVNLLSGGTATFTIDALLCPCPIGLLSNTATVTPPNGFTDTNPDNNRATETTLLSPTGDLSITKTDFQETDIPGTSISYTIVVSNAGPSSVQQALLNDALPAQITGVTWTATYAGSSSGPFSGTGSLVDVPINVVAGSTATFTVTGTIDPTATGTLTNTATITPPANFTDTNQENNTATDLTTLVPTADLSIVKTDGVGSLIPGSTTTYTITVTNRGPSSVSGATVEDVLPSGVSFVSATDGASYNSNTNTVNFVSGTLAPGASTSFTLTVLVGAGLSGELANSATVSPPGGVQDPNPGNNTSTDLTTLTPSGDLSITKTDGQATDVPGTGISYTIVVSNSGPSHVSGAVVNDPVPDDIDDVVWTAVYSAGSTGPTSGSGPISDALIDLLAAGTATFTVSGTINPSASGLLINTATVSAPANFTDNNASNNSATDTTTLVPTADLAITKTDGQTTDIPGTGIAYTVVVSNSGPSDVSGATVRDLIPASITAASWTAVYSGDADGATSGVGSIIDLPIDLPVGGTVTFTISGTISPAATGVLSNTASVSLPAGVIDTNPANNSATDNTTLTPMVDLRLAKTNGVSSLTPGVQTTYTLTVFNDGTTPVPSATVVDNLPAGLSFVSGSAGVIHSGGTITYTAGSLAASGSESFTITVLVGANVSGSISNTATVTPPSGYTELTPGNNSATDTDSISAEVDLSVTITDGSSVYRENGETVYTIVVKNDGPGVANGARVESALPVGATGGSWTATFTNGSSGATSGSGAIDQPITLLPGGVATYTYRVSVGAGTIGKLVGQARVTKPAGMIESNLADNTDLDLGYLPVVVTGTEVGCLSAPFITVIDPYTGAIRTQFSLFESKFRGGVRVALGDVDGDGIDEIIAAAGSGRLGEILVFRLDGTPMPAYRTVPFGSKYKSGVEIAVGDIDGDGIDDIVASASRGPGDVNIYRVNPAAADPVPDTPTRSFRAFSTKFRGGASIAVADMGTFQNGSAIDRSLPDGRAEIIVGSGSGMTPQVMIYDVSGTPSVIDTITPMTSTPKYRNGVSVSTGRFNGDAIPEVIIAAGRSGGTVYEIYDGIVGPGPNAQAARDAVFADIAKATSPLFSAAIDLDGDGQMDRMFNTQGDNGTRPYPGIRITDMDGDLINTITSLNFSQRIAASRPRLPEPQVMTASGLIFEDIEVGTGPRPTLGQTVSINYIVSAQNGYVLQSTYLTGAPVSLVLGGSQVIDGLNEAIASMLVGGRRQVIIPVNLASGSVPSGLPVNTTLVFDIELLSVRP